MPVTLEKIRKEAMGLTAKARATLARELILSLEDAPPEDPAEVERAWDETIARRIREVKSGKVKCRPVADVLAEMRLKFG